MFEVFLFVDGAIERKFVKASSPRKAESSAIFALRSSDDVGRKPIHILKTVAV